MIDMDASVDYCFTYLILIPCKYLYQCIYGNTKQAIFNGWITLNMYKCTYNPGVASTHCVQQLCEICDRARENGPSGHQLQQSFKVNSRSVVVVESIDGGFSSHDVLKS